MLEGLVINDITILSVGLALLVPLWSLWEIKVKTDQKRSWNPFVLLYRKLKQRMKAWKFLIDAPQQIEEAYVKAQGNPFEVLAPDNRYVFVSSKQHIKEISAAPDDTLSLHAASKQMFQPRYSMHGFNWHDIRSHDGIGFVRTLRTILTAHLPSMVPDFQTIISNSFQEEFNKQETVDGAKQIRIFPFMRNLLALCNGRAIFGEDLVKDKEFMRTAVEFIENVFKTAEVIRVTPKFMAPVIGKAFSMKNKTQKALFDTILRVVEQRLDAHAQEKPGEKKERPNDCITWIIETSSKFNPWSIERVVHEVMAVWFGAVHALSITLAFVVHDLCLHPEYIKHLRAEIEGPAWNDFIKTTKGLPLMDSFIKESARFTPAEAMVTRRQALKPFVFSDGTRVDKGDWTCIPLQGMLHDERYFPEADKFHGFRYVDGEKPEGFPMSQPEGPSKFIETTDNFHIWGTGRMACAGRYYVDVVMKLTLAHIIRNFDIDFSDKEASRSLSWRTTIIPHPWLRVSFRPRQE